MRPNHLHFAIEAPGYRKLITAVYIRGDKWLTSDAVFGVKKDLVLVRALTPGDDEDSFLTVEQDLKEIDNAKEARRRGFPGGKKFKLLQYDFILVPSDEADIARQKTISKGAKSLL